MLCLVKAHCLVCLCTELLAQAGLLTQATPRVALVPQFVRVLLQGADECMLLQQPLIYCHFATGAEDPCYMPVKDWEDLKAILRETVDTYNELHSAMHLVLFEDAMQHV